MALKFDKQFQYLLFFIIFVVVYKLKYNLKIEINLDIFRRVCNTANYIGEIISKAYKRKYGTKESIINQIYHNGKGWIKNQKKSTKILNYLNHI